jgi:hypothetical protein
VYPVYIEYSWRWIIEYKITESNKDIYAPADNSPAHSKVFCGIWSLPDNRNRLFSRERAQPGKFNTIMYYDAIVLIVFENETAYGSLILGPFVGGG